MRHIVRIGLLLAWAPLLSAQSVSPTTIEVPFHGSVKRVVEGATAAFSHNEAIATAQLEGQTLLLFGVADGETTVVVVFPNAVTTFTVRVLPDVVRRLPTRPFVSYLTEATEGAFDLDFVSAPWRIRQDFRYQEAWAGYRNSIHITTLEHVGSPTWRRFSLPWVSYRLESPKYTLGLLDETVQAAPLTVEQVQVRGVHWTSPRLQVHAGRAALGLFEGLYEAVLSEMVATVGYRQPLGGPWRARFDAATIWDVRENLGGAGPGLVAGAGLEYRPNDRRWFTFDLAQGRGRLGAAAELRLRSERTTTEASVRIFPSGFPVIGLGRAHAGHDGYFSWQWQDSSPRSVAVRYRDTRYLGLVATTHRYLEALMNFSPRPGWQATLGATFGDVRTGEELRVRNTEVHSGVSWRATRWLEASFQGALRKTSGGGKLGYRIAPNLRFLIPRGTASIYFSQQTNAASLSLLLRQPYLAELIAVENAQIGNLRELADFLELLRQRDLLKGVTLRLNPRRRDWGATFDWHPAPRWALRYAYLGNSDRSELSTFAQSAHQVGVEVPLGQRNAVRFSVLAARLAGEAGGQWKSVVQLSWMHRFGMLPVPLFWRSPTTGRITGVVFEDVDVSGHFSESDRPLAGLEVLMDGIHTARTDAQGQFEFTHVGPGRHRLELPRELPRARFFTTSSSQDAAADERVEFGVVFHAGRVTGRVISDAGVGLAGVVVKLTGPARVLTAITAGDGSFTFWHLPVGTYQVELDPASIPLGYSLLELRSQTVQVDAEPAHVEFVLKALRTLSGVVVGCDGIGLVGAQVRLGEQTMTTNGNGEFILRQLPPGTLRIQVQAGSDSATQEVQLSSAAGHLKGVRVVVGACNNNRYR